MKRMKFFLLALALTFVLAAAFGCAQPAGQEGKTFTVGFDVSGSFVRYLSMRQLRCNAP